MNQPKKDIESLDEVKVLVNTFYDKIRIDDVLGPIFNERIKDQWPVHLEKMYRFWQTVLLNEHSYQGSPFRPHAQLPVGSEHFNHWLSLFESTLNELFEGPKADEALWRAKKMAEMFQIKITYYRQNKSKPIL
ncbi:group III truncated hemoglobin [Membranihabitans marinus]|uniref:group III truncated hemoglobin n=1 Tax=Membranihabitans marinus TaxID=1227546 RepID=UPI001F386E1D|nr:group III truncated hemoglobin [Membranihabitans marinus]